MGGMDWRPYIDAHAADWVAVRHELHRIPEIRFEEHQTSARIQAFLQDRGIPLTAGHARGTGVAAEIPGQGPGRLLLRADIDALEIEEQTGLPYASTRPGLMHACGHDGHTACLLGAAQTLWEHRDQIPVSVRCIFQPGEEEAAGGRLIVEEGLLDDVDACFALHGWPSLPTGDIQIGGGPVMASADFFHIEIHGKGGHAADPGACVDPVLAAAHLITALQSLASRELSPWESGVVSVTRMEGGTTSNIIPDCAVVEGTVRALDPAVRDRLLASIERVAKGQAETFRAKAKVVFGTNGYPPTINDHAASAYAARIGEGVFGAEHVHGLDHPYMTAEDFSYYLQRRPGTFAFLGVAPGPGEPYPGLHTPRYDFSDASLPGAVHYFCSLVSNWSSGALENSKA